MRADACILEPLLEMTANCVYKCEPLTPEESQEDAGPSSKNIRNVQGAGCDLGSNLLFRVTVQCFGSVFYYPPIAFPPFHSSYLSE